MKNLLKKTQSGFTIIEVTIVLAIAAVIMVIVFTAVPALERSSRNTQRRNDATHYSNLVNEYIANNAGAVPTTSVAGSDTFSQLKTVTVADGSTASSATAPGTSLSTVYYFYNAQCSGVGKYIAGSSTQAAVLYNVESSGGTNSQCINTTN